MAIPPDPHYIPAFSIEDVLLDKDTGAPLTGGVVTFWHDNQRGVMKPVYQITGTSPNYTFVQLPNPMILSSIGTFQDALENPVIPYFFPYDAGLNVDLYYITVESSGGVAQFTRQAQPYIPSSGSDTVISGTIGNSLSNPQFAEVLFDTQPASFTFSYTGAVNQATTIAPDWDLIVSGTGTVTVSQLTPLGALNVPTNPGTLLQISSAGLDSLQLQQRIIGSPNLWGNGWLSGTFVAKTYSGVADTLTLNYTQSDGAIVDETIVTASLSANYTQFPGSVFLDLSTSGENFPNAFVDIFFNLPVGVMIDITSVMVVSTGGTSVANIGYDQESNPRQIDHLFHYYEPQLAYKPIPSYLVGWDFPMNPAQATGRGNIGPLATGANKAFYAWDQTIVFQTVNSSILVEDEAAGNGAIVFGASAAGQVAMMQYLGNPMCREILLQRFCSNIITAYTGSAPAGITVTMWYTTNGSLPTLTNTFFTGLDANGVPTGVISGWHMVPRDSLGNANVKSVTSPYTSYQMSGWDLDNDAAALTANFFAIVIGSTAMPINATLGFKSVSLQGGDIPTIPAPQSPSAVLVDCQYYYQKSFIQGTPPGAGLGTVGGVSFGVQYVGASLPSVGPIVSFPVDMRTTPSVVLYNPNNANNQIFTPTIGDWSSCSATSITSTGFEPIGTTNPGSTVLNPCIVSWTADARLGVV